MVEEQDLYLIKLELYYFLHEKIVNASAVGTFKEFIYLLFMFRIFSFVNNISQCLV